MAEIVAPRPASTILLLRDDYRVLEKYRYTIALVGIVLAETARWSRAATAASG